VISGVEFSGHRVVSLVRDLEGVPVSPGREQNPSKLASDACIAYNACMQYTIRNVPEYLDAALRNAARHQGKSLNDVTVQALVRGAGLSEAQRRKRDLADLAGSWQKDAAFDNAVAAQDTVDEALWPKQQMRVGKRTESAAARPDHRARKRTAA